jgi:hypothetical protein
MRGSSEGASTTPSQTFDNQTAKQAAESRNWRCAIYRDYAPASSGTKGTPIALRIADPFQPAFFAKSSANLRPILGVHPPEENKRGLRAIVRQKTHTFCQGRMIQAQESPAFSDDEIGQTTQSR